MFTQPNMAISLICLMLFFPVKAEITDIPPVEEMKQAIAIGAIKIQAPHIIENLAHSTISITSINYSGSSFIQYIWFFSDIEKKPLVYYKLSESAVVEGLLIRINIPYVPCEHNKTIFIVAQLSDKTWLGGYQGMQSPDRNLICGNDHG